MKCCVNLCLLGLLTNTLACFTHTLQKGRLGTGFDIAMAAVFLSSDGSGSFVSGDTLVVDGAEWLFKPPMVPRELVSELSRKVEAKSRALSPNMVSKL
jgi:peroxisomal 2,4-dienoyl-CoA reductase